MNQIKPNKLKKLLNKSKKKDQRAQMELFKMYGPKMKAVCRRYLYESNEVSAVLNQAFLKVFEKLETFQFEGSFEGWIRKIVVRECLNENQKKKPFWQSIDEMGEQLYENPIEETDIELIKKAISQLPDGYRTIFNLYEIEGFKHEEIAKELEISVSASRSQLARAKKTLREKLKHLAA